MYENNCCVAEDAAPRTLVQEAPSLIEQTDILLSTAERLLSASGNLFYDIFGQQPKVDTGKRETASERLAFVNRVMSECAEMAGKACRFIK